MENVKNDIRTVMGIRLSSRQLFYWMTFCALIIWPLNQHNRLDLALPILNSIGLIGILIAVKWPLRRRTWFWATTSIIAAIHVPLVLMIPWTLKWVPAIAVAAIDTVDFLTILMVLSAVERVVDRTTSDRR
jgi:hypothetical protein